MCVVYSNYGIIFFENLKFSKDASLIFETLNVFCGKNRTAKNGTFSVRKSAILYFVSGDQNKHNILTKIRYPV
jgi:predicted ATPase